MLRGRGGGCVLKRGKERSLSSSLPDPMPDILPKVKFLAFIYRLGVFMSVFPRALKENSAAVLAVHLARGLRDP